uniref:Uncharacterized protein n=1 Tax=Tetranychus urticae TaxID=32264 RepID=T1KUZ3_TETUR
MTSKDWAVCPFLSAVQCRDATVIIDLNKHKSAPRNWF